MTRCHSSLAISVLVFPLAGWLADVYVGRYQMISACLKIMWLGAILFSIKSVLQSSKYLYLEEIAILLLIIGLGGFQANIIQFSLDQLFDSSSFEITSLFFFTYGHISLLTWQYTWPITVSVTFYIGPLLLSSYPLF